MRKILYIIALCFALSANHSAQAQSLDDLLKGLSSFFGSSEQPKQTPKITHPDAYDLIGRWTYDAPTMDYTGDIALASVAISTLEGQLPTLMTKFNVVAGRDFIEVGDDGTIVVARDKSRTTAYCSYYDSYSGEATMTFNVDGKSINITATILEQDGKTKILFNANKLMSLLEQHYSKFKENTTLQMAKTVIDNYPGIRVGAVMKR